MDDTYSRLDTALRHVAHFHKDEILQSQYRVFTELQRGASLLRFRLAG